jgi:hypothetical protein
MGRALLAPGSSDISFLPREVLIREDKKEYKHTD